MKPLLPLFIFLLFLSAACSNTERTIGEEVYVFDENRLDEILPDNLTLQDMRSRLSDSYSNRTNEIPEYFTRKKTEREVIFNPNEGFRIQIYSGQSVEMADKIASRFRTWADTTIANYLPQTYTFFRTPYYRVHVGDFHDRERAILFSNIVKRAFPDAWVVHDRVEPANVPADTVRIELE